MDCSSAEGWPRSFRGADWSWSPIWRVDPCLGQHPTMHLRSFSKHPKGGDGRHAGQRLLKLKPCLSRASVGGTVEDGCSNGVPVHHGRNRVDCGDEFLANVLLPCKLLPFNFTWLGVGSCPIGQDMVTTPALFLEVSQGGRRTIKLGWVRLEVSDRQVLSLIHI